MNNMVRKMNIENIKILNVWECSYFKELIKDFQGTDNPLLTAMGLRNIILENTAAELPVYNIFSRKQIGVARNFRKGKINLNGVIEESIVEIFCDFESTGEWNEEYEKNEWDYLLPSKMNLSKEGKGPEILEMGLSFFSWIKEEKQDDPQV